MPGVPRPVARAPVFGVCRSHGRRFGWRCAAGCRAAILRQLRGPAGSRRLFDELIAQAARPGRLSGPGKPALYVIELYRAGITIRSGGWFSRNSRPSEKNPAASSVTTTSAS